MQGKNVVVTGPTSGIGYVIAEALAAQGAQVVLACRNANKGEAARAAIASTTGSQAVAMLQVDTASRKSVYTFANEFKRRYRKLHVLVNNAGINQPKRCLNPEGVDMVFATNVLGYYWMTLALEDVLLASTPARVVNVASTYAGELDLGDLQFTRRKYSGITAYKQSKACDRMLSWAFSRRLAPRGVTVNAMAPGFVYTGLYREMRGPAALLMRLLGLTIGGCVAAGADTAIWLASSPEVEGQTGNFYYQRRPLPCEFADVAKEDALLKECAALSKLGDS